MEDPSTHNIVRKRTHFFHNFNTTLCQCCTSCLIPTVIAIITSFLACQYFISTTMEEHSSKSTFSTRNKVQGTQKLSSKDTLLTETPWASFYLNQEEFYKGIHRLPWKQDTNSNTGVDLIDNINFKISKKGLYEIYSKITIEFSRQPKQKYAYHNLSLNDTTGNTWILEKNIITVPYEHSRTRRSFLTSDLFLLREFNVGDTIGVIVSNTSLVYHSKIDNTVKIIKRA